MTRLDGSTALHQGQGQSVPNLLMLRVSEEEILFQAPDALYAGFFELSPFHSWHLGTSALGLAQQMKNTPALDKTIAGLADSLVYAVEHAPAYQSGHHHSTGMTVVGTGTFGFQRADDIYEGFALPVQAGASVASASQANAEQITLRFQAGEHGSLAGNNVFQLAKGSRLSSIDLPRPVPNPGYRFVEWNPAIPDANLPLMSDMSFTASFARDGAPVINDPSSPNPAEGYVRVEFLAGANGSLLGSTRFDILEGASFDHIPVPKAVADTGYRFHAWIPQLLADQDPVTYDISFLASFVEDSDGGGSSDPGSQVPGGGTPGTGDEGEEIIVNPSSPYPAPGYHRLHFHAAANGSLQGARVVDVKDGVPFGRVPVPAVLPAPAHRFTTWTPALPSASEAVRQSAQYIANFARAQAVIADPVSPESPAGYVRVNFTTDGHGHLQGPSRFDVLQGTHFDQIPVPRPVPAVSYKFSQWTPYLPMAKHAVTQNLSFTAVFAEGSEVIEEPTSPNPLAGYVRVSFTTDGHGSLQGPSRFDVLRGTTFNKIPLPTPVAAAQYKFASWTPALPAGTEPVNMNASYTAQFVKQSDLIEDPQTPEPPAGYVRVSFVAGANGSLQGTTVYDVLQGTAFNKILVPTPVAAAQYKFASWSPALPAGTELINANAAYTANFAKQTEVIEDPQTPEPPVGYVRVSFTAGANGSLQGTTVYDVLQGTAFNKILVPTPVAAAQYKFASWTPALPAGTEPVNVNASYTAQFIKQSDLIEDPQTPEPPVGYVRVSFAAGANGSLQGTTVYDVLQGTAFNKILVPTAVAADQYKFASWTPALPAGTEPVNVNASYTAQFVKQSDLIEDPQTPEPPVGYVRVSFAAGANGSLQGTTVYDVLQGTAFNKILVPTAVAADQYKFASWTPALPAGTEPMNANAAYTANFAKQSEVIEDPQTPEPPVGYVRVSFTAGANGSLQGTTVYDVLQGTTFNKILVPTAVAADQYKFASWSPALPAGTEPINVNAAYTANFAKQTEVIEDPQTPEPPVGYVRVSFTAGANGSLQGTTVYDVLQGTAFNKILVPTPVAAAQYKFASWTPALPAGTEPVNVNASYTAQFVKESDLIEDPQTPEPPVGYVRVSFAAGANGSLQGTTVYDVLQGTAFNKILVPTAVAAAQYKFASWTPALPAGTEPINVNTNYTAQFVKQSDLIEDPQTPEPPAGYVRVSFAAGANGSLQGTTVYDVLQGTAFNKILVPTPVAADQYKFASWSPALPAGTEPINANAAYTANFAKQSEVIEDPQTPEPPVGYVRVSFTAGANGSLQGTTVYDVLQGTTFNKILVPTAVAADQYKFASWTPALPLGTEPINANAAYTANFAKQTEVIEDPQTSEPPVGYVRVSFTAGANGSLQGTTVYDVLQGTTFNKILVPTAVAAAQYKFASWSPALPAGTEPINANTSYTAQFVKESDLIEDPNTPEPPVGYVRVSFTAGANGSLQGTTVYDVLQGTTFNKILVPTAVAAAQYKFASWSPALPAGTEPINVNASYTAQFVKQSDLIEDPQTPEPPAGYVRVSFAAGANGSLQGTTVYDVLQGTAFNKILVPTAVAADQYKFASWTPALPAGTEPINANAAYTANFAKQTDVIEDPQTPEPPVGYVRVSFAAGANGSLQGTTVYDVLQGTAFNKILVPTPVAAAQYKFASWTPALPAGTELINVNASYTAQFVKQSDLIEDPQTPEPPAGYVRVSFAAGANGSLQGTTVYDVLQGTAFNKIQVPTPVASDQHMFTSWSPALPAGTELVNANAAYTASFAKQPEVIEDPQTPEPPVGYVRVSFTAGANGSLQGTTVYDVLQGTAFNKILVPTAVAADQYKFASWTPALPLGTEPINSNTSYTAQFVKESDLIEDPQTPESPAGYVRVSFAAGANGSLQGTTVYDVLQGTAFNKILVPTPVAASQYKFASWTPALPAGTEPINANASYTAQFVKQSDLIEDPQTPEPPVGYVRVSFTAGANGSLQGTTVYDVLQGTAFNKILVPTAVAADQYKFASWTPALPAGTEPINSNASYTAQFVKQSDLIEDPNTPEPPVGYVRVSFAAGANGSLQGTTVYDVLQGTAFNKILVPTPVAAAQHMFTSWSPALPAGTELINANAAYTASFAKQPEVIEDPQTPESPAGYVRVSFTAGANGSLQGTTVYDVLQGTTFNKILVPTAVAANQYKFASWSPALPAGTELINANTSYTAQFVKQSDLIEDPNTPEPPVGYVRVSFTAGANGSLQGTTVFDVLQGTAFSKITVPSPVASAQHMFTSWSPALPPGTELVNANATYTASFAKQPEVIENPNTPEPPAGYVRVSFTAGANGSLQGTTVYDVLQGTAFNKILVPTPVAASQYKFASWSPALPAGTELVNAAAAYTASFAEHPEVIENPNTPEPAAGYVRVSFTAGANGSLQGTTVFDVLQGTAFNKITVPSPVAAAQHMFTSWSPALPAGTELVNAAAAYTANFAKQPEVIEDPQTPEPPAGYVRVSFTAGANGSLQGTTVYDVLQGTAFNKILVPTPVAASQYKFASWSPALPAGTELVNAAAAYTASFAEHPEVIENPNTPEPAAGYVRVSFTAGANGSLQGTTVFDVLQGTAFNKILVPTPVAAAKHMFTSWAPALPAGTELVNANAAYTASFAKQAAVLVNPQTPTPPEGYHRLSFLAAAHGSLSGARSMDVLEGTPFGELPVPTPVPETGYRLEAWAPTLPAASTSVQASASYVANFMKLQEVIEDPQTPEPDAAYVRVSFTAGANGSLQGTTVYDVLRGTAFSKIVVPTPVAAAQHKFASWTPALPAGTEAMNANATYTAVFAEQAEVLVDPQTPEPPAGYVRVSFTASANGSLQGATVFDVLQGTTFNKITVPSPVAAARFTFASWSPVLPAGTEAVTTNAAYTANFKQVAAVIENPQTPTPPEGYHRFSFLAAANGSLSGSTSFDVLEGTRFSELPLPKPVPNESYEFASWTPVLPEASSLVSQGGSYIANFSKKQEVIENPQTPEAPAGYLRVSFVAGANGSLQGTRVFDVLQGTPFNRITVPAAVAAAQHKFASWNPSLPAGTTPVEAKASYTAVFAKLDEVIENPQTPEPAEGYVRVSFTAGANGSLQGTSVFDVLQGTSFNKITVPRPVGLAQYKFAAWTPALPAENDAVQANASYLASFAKQEAILVNPSTPTPPEGYHRLSFYTAANGKLSGAATMDVLEGTLFAELPVPTPVPNPQYRFEAWSPTLPEASSPVRASATYIASFVKQPEVIENPQSPEAPAGYVRVSFTAGANGSLSGTSVFDVLQGTAFEKISVPKAVASKGFKFASWSPALPTGSTAVEAKASYTAVFEKLEELIANPQTPEAPAGYLRLRFLAGANGSLQGTSVFDVLEGTAFSKIPVPTTVASTRYKFASWSPALPAGESLVTAAADYTANFIQKDEVIADPSTPTSPEGYVRVSFTAGANGSLQGTKVYDVLQGTAFQNITVPTTVPAIGYRFDRWTPGLPEGTSPIHVAATYAASFVQLPEVIENPTGTEPPKGYVRVDFVAAANGRLQGTSRFDIKAGLPFSRITVPNTVPEKHYRFEQWSPGLPAGTSPVQAQATYTASFVQHALVIVDPSTALPPEGYHRIEFHAAANGKLVGASRVDVREGTAFSQVPVPVPSADPKHRFVQWSPTLPAPESLVTGGRSYIASFEKLQEILVDPSTPEVPAGYLRIDFVAGAHGRLQGSTRFDVLEGVSFGKIPVPSPVADAGHGFASWTPNLPQSSALVRAHASYTATFVKTQEVIENPVEPQPSDGYARILFEAGPNGGLSGITSYDLLKGLPFSKITVPGTVPAAGYKFQGWSPALPAGTEAVNTNQTYTAQFVQKSVTENPGTPAPPEGYVRINFVSLTNGGLSGTTVFDVRKGTPFSEITVPTPVPEQGYRFDAWTPSLPAGTTAVEANAVYIAGFAKLDDVIPNPTSFAPPEGYVRVSFVAAAHGKLQGTASYDMRKGLPFSRITAPTPVADVDYGFKTWTPALPAGTELMNSNAYFIASFELRNHPGYIKVTYQTLPVASLEMDGQSGQTVYAYYPPGTTFGQLRYPKVTPLDSRLRMDKWKATKGTVHADGVTMTEDLTFFLNWFKSEHYIVIEYHVAEGEGHLEGPTSIAVKANLVTFHEKYSAYGAYFDRSKHVPTPVPAPGWKAYGWTPSLPDHGQFLSSAGTSPNGHMYRYRYGYKFEKKTAVLPADPSVPNTDPDYVRVSFAAGPHGSLHGSTSFNVLKGSTFGQITIPGAVPDTGYFFNGWSPYLPEAGTVINEGMHFVAMFGEKKEVITNPTGPTPPENYARIVFTSGANGSLSGTQTFDVLKGSSFDKITVPTVLPAAGYRAEGWSPALPSASSVINADASYKMSFASTRPQGGYHRVTFYANGGTFDLGNGTTGTEYTDYYKEGTLWSQVKVPRIMKTPYLAHFEKWSPSLPTGPVSLTGDMDFQATYNWNKYASLFFDVKGEGGTLEGPTVYRALLNLAVFDPARHVPTPVPKYGYKFYGWEPELPAAGTVFNYQGNYHYKALFYKMTEVISNPTGETPGDSYVRVNFSAGANGSLDGASVVDIFKNLPFSKIAVPTPKPATGYQFKEWSPALPDGTTPVTEALSFEAIFEKKPGMTVNPTTPEPGANQVRVSFTATSGGSLNGVTVYDVDKGTNFSEITVPTIAADEGYEFKGWSPAIVQDAVINENMSFVASFEKPTPKVMIYFFLNGPGFLLGPGKNTYPVGTLFKDVSLPTWMQYQNETNTEFVRFDGLLPDDHVLTEDVHITVVSRYTTVTSSTNNYERSASPVDPQSAVLLPAELGLEEAEAIETAPTDPVTGETIPTETAPTETEPSETEPSETAPTETQPAETEPSETAPTETQPSETEPSETAPTETQPAETEPSETAPTETQPAETEPSETAPTETQPAETEPSETAPTETQPAETEPSETAPTETKPAETKEGLFAWLKRLRIYVSFWPWMHANSPRIFERMSWSLSKP